jgi:hypothetical protein
MMMSGCDEENSCLKARERLCRISVTAQSFGASRFLAKWETPERRYVEIPLKVQGHTTK